MRLLAGLAVLGAAVSGGAAVVPAAPLPPRPTPIAAPAPAPRPVERVSRADDRVVLTPQQLAHGMVRRHGWGAEQWTCLKSLWMRESRWDVHAQNSSGAYGIPQALPATKMARMGADWRSNPVTQIRWGLWYIARTYGTPCAALQHSYSHNYY